LTILSFICIDQMMVLLKTTPPLKAAADEYLRLHAGSEKSEPLQQQLERLEKAELDGPIEHSDVINISKGLVKQCQDSDTSAKNWRLDTLLKGTTVYQPPPPPKPEPVSRSHVHPQNIMTYTNNIPSPPNTKP
jgi:hypothetical protein